MPKNSKKTVLGMSRNCSACKHNHVLTYIDCKQMQYRCILRFAGARGKPAYDNLCAIQEKEDGTP